MRVQDEQAWQNQLTELAQDELGRKFKTFLEFWVDAAEKMMSESANGVDRLFTRESTVYHHFSKAFELAEQTYGWLSIEWLAQMLLVIVSHWEHGEALQAELSPFEKRLIEQAAAVKLAELQTAASIPTGE